MIRWCVIGILVWSMAMLGAGGCRPALVCNGDINTQILDPRGESCINRCQCNNQKYTGQCINQQCKASLREGCSTPGSIRACQDEHSGYAGYQQCQPTHLYLRVWGDCRADLDPEHPKGEAAPDAGESQMGGDKELVETNPETTEVRPEEPSEIAPEAAPDRCPTSLETCGDGLDNNCNGQIDEGCTPCAPTQPLWSLKSPTGVGNVLHHPWRPQLLTSTNDNRAQIWDLLTGKPLATLSGHTKPVRAVDIGLDGRQFATASDDGSVRIWDGQSFQLRQRIEAHPQGATLRPVTGVAFHPLGKGFVTIADGPDGIALWDSHGKVTHRLTQNQEPIDKRLMVRISPDGKRLAVLGVGQSKAQNVVVLWDLTITPPAYLFAITGLAEGRLVMAFHPDSQILLTSQPDEVQLWDLRTKQVSLTLPGGAHAAAWGPDGHRLALAQDQDIAIWEWQGEALLARVPTATPATALSFSGDSAQLAASLTSQGAIETQVWTCPCTQANTTGSCYQGAAGSAGRGICKAGQWRCDDNKRRSPCTNMQPPTPEFSDGLDNDCNGLTDDGFVDLAIADLSVTPTSALANTTRSFQVCVHNIGHLASRSDRLVVRLYLSTDGQITPQSPPITGTAGQPKDLEWIGLQGGKAPECKTLTMTFQGLATGAYTLGAIVDPTNDIPETNETNNRFQVPVEIK